MTRRDGDGPALEGAVPPLLLYDGFCGLCDRTVQFALARDRTGTLRFATLQGAHGTAVRAQYAALAGVDSVVWLDADGAHVRSEAAIRLGRYLGGAWSLVAAAARLVPRAWRDAVYAGVARRRYRVFGRRDHCRPPLATQRPRFLD